MLLGAVVNDLLDARARSGRWTSAVSSAGAGFPNPLGRSCAVTHVSGTPRPVLGAWRLVVEVDGIHHAWAENVVGDALRQNFLAIEGNTVLRVPLLGYRLCPDDFFDQIEEALSAAGWSSAA